MANLQLPDKDALPLYGSVTGVALSADIFHVCEGVELRKGVFEIFGVPMLAFAEPPTPGTHTPLPWVPVHGGFHLKSRAELVIRSLAAFDGFLPSQAMWIVAALLRLHVEAPVRISTVANVPLASLPEHRNARLLLSRLLPFSSGCIGLIGLTSMQTGLIGYRRPCRSQPGFSTRSGSIVRSRSMTPPHGLTVWNLRPSFFGPRLRCYSTLARSSTRPRRFAPLLQIMLPMTRAIEIALTA